MAKIRQYSNDNGSIGLTAHDLWINVNHTKAVYTVSGGGTITLRGDNIQWIDGRITSGTVDKVIFRSLAGDDVIVATDARYKAKTLGDAMVDIGTPGLFSALLTGNDKVIGSARPDGLYGENGNDKLMGRGGNDYLSGGRGNDILTGGKGADTFYFDATHKGHDTITDLQTTGPNMDTVGIVQEITSTKKANHGADTLLTLTDGSTILIKDVTRAEWIDFYYDM